jgi:hypothetical protein
MQILSNTERLQVIQDNINVGTLLRESVVCDAFRMEVNRIKGDFDNFFKDCMDTPLSRNDEDVLRQWQCTNTVWYAPNIYRCSLPSFIWQSLNAVNCRVRSTSESVIGTAPRNLCNIDYCKITKPRKNHIIVDLITNSKWPRFAGQQPVRIGFSFAWIKFGCKVFDLGVWESTTSPGEWEMGYLDEYKTFWRDVNAVEEDDYLPTNVEGQKCHPIYHLLSRVVQVMTGN